jgi:hypothetical protein
MYLIKIFSDFCSSEQCKQNYETVYHAFFMENYGPNKKVYFTTEENYNYAIIINQAMPQLLNIPIKNVIGFAFEPYELLRPTTTFIEYAQKYIYKYYIGNKNNLPEPFIEGFSYMWFTDPHRTIEKKEKKNIMSIIVSEKRFAPGHQYRHKLIEKIIECNLPIDIYGRGSLLYKSNFVKGIFMEEIPYKDYLFSICIENFSNPHYFSEKIMSPLMYNCMPIYLGCKNIFQYFEKENIISLTGNLNADIKQLEEILENPNKFYKSTYTKENQQKINLIENIDHVFL